VVHDLEATVSRARRAGVDHARIILDPGLGFGKRKEQNSQIIARLQQLAKLDCPILAGPSRKSFLVQGTEKGTAFATASAVAACILSGAHMVRVHDVREMKVVASVADAVLNGAAE
jgi:dihydropteroate synthase